MAMKIKGIYKGFKFFTQIFVVKEREMEIGYPTDVKHVSHIGWDGPSTSRSASAPSWMNEFKTAPDFSATSVGNIGDLSDSKSNALSTWSSQDFEQSMRLRPASEMFKEFPSTNIPKKQTRKKTRSSSSPKSSSSSSRSSRAVNSKATYIAMEATA